MEMIFNHFRIHSEAGLSSRFDRGRRGHPGFGGSRKSREPVWFSSRGNRSGGSVKRSSSLPEESCHDKPALRGPADRFPESCSYLEGRFSKASNTGTGT